MGTQNEVFDTEVMGEQLKKLRKSTKLSQEKFAERFGMSKDTIFNYEKGKTVETVFKDDRAIDKLTYYIEREGIICVLVRSIWDISTDRETVKSIMKLASEHNVSINEENRGFEPATLVWDGGAGC